MYFNSRKKKEEKNAWMASRYPTTMLYRKNMPRFREPTNQIITNIKSYNEKEDRIWLFELHFFN